MKYFKFAATFMAVGLTIAIAMRPSVWANIEYAFASFDHEVIVVLLILFCFMRLFQGLSLCLSLKSLNHDLPLRNALGLVALKGFFNLAFAGAGLFAQAVRAKSSLNVGYSTFAYASLYQAMVLVTVLGFLTAAVGVVVLPSVEKKAMFGILGLAIAVAPFLTLSVVRRVKSLKNAKIARIILRFVQYRLEDWKWLLPLAVLGTFFFLSRLIRISIIAITVEEGIRLEFFSLAVIVADLSTVIPITPGGIGVRELVIGAGGNWVGQLDIFLAAAVVDRIIGLVFSLVHGLLVLFVYQFSAWRRRGKSQQI